VSRTGQAGNALAAHLADLGIAVRAAERTGARLVVLENLYGY
jgi:uncharacterized protein YbjT (DUF2867 family)